MKMTKYFKAVKLVDALMDLEATSEKIRYSLEDSGYSAEEIKEIEFDYNNQSVIRSNK